MDINNMMNMIDNKVANDKIKKQAEIDDINRRRIAAENTIRGLKPRIDNLIRLANYAKQNGIKFNKSGIGGHEGYDTGMFYTNGWSHLVGFVGNEDVISTMGINAGGFCGKIDFRTNGNDIYGLVEGSHEIVEPLIGHMERFVNTFDTFESEFCKYIEKCCK